MFIVCFFFLVGLAEKLLYSSEKFDPKFFLSHVHQNTAAADFEGAEQGLKEDLKLRNNELKKLVKENFDCFISCKNTIDGKWNSTLYRAHILWI